MSGLPELQEAVRRIPGIATATIRWPDPLGPASLRVEFDGEADHQDVGEAVIRTLVDVGDVDLSTMRLEREERPRWSARPVLTTLVLDRMGPSLSVEVGLSVGGHDISAEAHTDGDALDELQTVARATVAALARVDRTQPYVISHVGVTELAGAEVVHVMVEVSGADMQPLLGTALVGRDAREATARATLDAVNRHFDVSRRAGQLDLTDQPPM